MRYSSMSPDELKAERAMLEEQYAFYKGLKLKLNLARGVPAKKQLDLSMGIATALERRDDFFSAEGRDCRTYSAELFGGLPEMRKIFAELYGLPEDYIIIGGNSSLNMIYDTLMHLMLFGPPDAEPWYGKKVKFICTVPGYDRHFKILEQFGIEMLPVEIGEGGPDMDEVEEIVKDPCVKGFICVPKYSNPTGIVFSDEAVDRLAGMETAAKDFRIIWDNAYGIHPIYDDVALADIFAAAKKYDNEDRILYFSSTSKITFPGAGVAFTAVDAKNMEWNRKLMTVQTIGPDKLNQLRLIHYFKNADGVREHMQKHAAILRTKFDIALETFQRELEPFGIAQWTKPNGGYFVSLNVPDGCAKAVYELAKGAGVAFTPAGATYPYGLDPRDRNLRVAPTFPECDELQQAIDILCICVKLASIRKLMD